MSYWQSSAGAEFTRKRFPVTRAFVADSDAKHKFASDLIREMAERWAMEPYRLLEEKRLGREAS